jgi:hypothetical protein
MPFRPHLGYRYAPQWDLHHSTLRLFGLRGTCLWFRFAQPAAPDVLLTLGPASRAKTSPRPGARWRHGGRPDGRRHAGMTATPDNL